MDEPMIKVKDSKAKTRTRKQGNSLTLTVPNEFGLKSGLPVQPTLFENGIFYEFILPSDDFFNFDSDILKDIIADKSIPREDILKVFNDRKAQIPHIMDEMIAEAKKTSKPMSKEEMEKYVGL